MKPLKEHRASRLLHALAKAAIEHWRWFCLAQLLLLLICLAYTVVRLQFSTDKNDLISARESYRREFLEFKKEFKIQDNLFVLVGSESREKNLEFVERLAARLLGDPQFAAVYYRAGLRLMGPKAFLFLPEQMLAELQQNLRTNQPLFRTYSQATNIETLFTLVNRQFRLAEAKPAGEPNRLPRALQTLQWIVDKASDSIESREIPLVPNITTVFGRSANEARKELYLTFDRGRIFVLVTQAKEPRQEQATITRLRKCIARTQAEVPGVNVEVTGEAVLRHDEMRQARHDTEVAALIALALTASIFIGSCRGILRPFMATVCLLTGIGYTLGFATLAVGRLNILSITLVPILIGLAIDYGVHLIFRYEEDQRRGHSPRLAIGKTFGFTAIGVVTNALTIAGAFYCMLLTDFKGMQEMGLLAGTGVMVCLIPMLALLPVLLVAGKLPPSEQPSGRGKHRRDPLHISLRALHGPEQAPQVEHRRRGWIRQLYLKRPWWVLAGGTLFTLFTVFQAPKVQFDYNLLNLQSRGLPAVRIQKQLIREGAQSLLYCAVIADSLSQAEEWERRINQLPSVARVLSLVKYLTEDQERKLGLIREIKQELGAIRLPPLDTQPVNADSLNQTLFSLSGYLGLAAESAPASESAPSSAEMLRSLRASVNRMRRLIAADPPSASAKLTTFQQALFTNLHETIRLIEQQDDRQRLQPEDVPVFLRDFFISGSGKFLLQVYPKEDVWQREQQARFIQELRTVDPKVTGSPVQFYEFTSRLRKNVQRASVYAAGVVAILVFVHFRRVSSVLLALLPVALGYCWMLGLMGWLGIPFNPVNIVSSILVIGIGVTNGIHILNRFAEEPYPNILGRSTGKAVLVSALNTIAGFGSLMVAKHQGIASLGLVMAIGTGACVVAALAFLPAILTLLCRIGWRPTEPPEHPPDSNASTAATSR